MDGGAERIADPAELVQVRRQARAVHVKSLLAAVVFTVLLVMV